MVMLIQILTAAALQAMGGVAVMSQVQSPSLFQGSLEATLGVARNATTEELAQIEGLVRSTFDALPKEREGRVGSRGAHYIIYRFFTQSYGWRISGLESVASKMTTMTFAKKGGPTKGFGKLSQLELFQNKAPNFAKILERYEIEHGFSLSDIAVVIAALHRLILDESHWILEDSYALAGHDTWEDVSEEEARSILRSYLLIVDFGKANNLKPEEHDLYKQTARDTPSEMPDIVELFGFVEEVFTKYTHNMRYIENESVAQKFNFFSMEEMSRLMLEGFGLWQMGRCRAMKADLMIMSRPAGSGRVPLEAFHAHPRNSDSAAVFAFTETEQRLREAEVLDETTTANISVLVADFMQIASNCVSTSKFYSICCVDECEGIMQELEAQVNAPAAPVDVLLAFVENVSSPTVFAPRDLDQALISKLHGLAKQHDGLVPLHSRLFWQWMHFAYPNECPLPHAVATSSPACALQDVGADTALAQWSDQELLPLEEPAGDSWLQLVVTPNTCFGEQNRTVTS